MNMSRLPDDEQIEREWQAQEHALEQERRAAAAAADPVDVQRYRLLVRALRQSPTHVLPADFARRVAARATGNAPAADGIDTRFERGLLQGMIGVFGLATAAVIVTYGADWLPALAQPLQLGRLLGERWPLALLACLGVSIAVQRASLQRNR